MWKMTLSWAAGFAVLNVAMYSLLGRFWIGGSSFLPMIGQAGPGGKFIFSFVVNLGVIAGAMLSAAASGSFRFRLPRRRDLPLAVTGGILIGIGITLAPGTCSTEFVTGIPMLSAASFLSAAGTFLGAYVLFRWRGLL